MRFVSLWYVKRFCTAFIKTSAQCGFAKNCLKRYLQFLRGCKAAFYRWLSDGELVGAVAYFGGQNSAPDGWLLCNGAAVSRTTYAALFAVIGTTYGTGNGSTTFNLPNLIDKFVEGSATAGTEKQAGLPNITGKITADSNQGYPLLADNVSNIEGAYTLSSKGGKWGIKTEAPTNYGYSYMGFDASRSSAIYGNSTTVQPPALTMKPFIYTGKTSLNKWKRTA